MKTKRTLFWASVCVVLAVATFILLNSTISLAQNVQSLKDESLGGLKLGESLKEVIAKYGQPTTITQQENTDGTGEVLWAYEYSEQGMVLWFYGLNAHDKTPRLGLIQARWNSKAKTASGIGIGTRSKDVNKMYGLKGSSERRITDEENGLTLTFSLERDPYIGYPVNQITFSSKGPHCSPAGLSLHQMALIPSGCFNMGDAFSEGPGDDRPVHNVCLTSNFYMDVHEVTNAEYAACVSGGGCTVPSKSGSSTRSSYYGNSMYNNFPVIFVDWQQATAYCTWAGERLPTEAEWEYAARGGLSGKRFPWGDSISSANTTYSRSGDTSPPVYAENGYGGSDDTSPVGNYAANGYGLYDMSGNVWEWVNDWYLNTYYRSSPTNDPPGPNTGTSRVLRGGCWTHTTDILRVSFRFNYYFRTSQRPDIGFRCASSNNVAP